MSIFLRGFVIVALVAWNVRNIQASHYPLMFMTGAAISFVWWLNAGVANKSRTDALIYSLGAGLGTIAGAWLGS